MKIIDGGICAVKGVRAAGIKQGKMGIAVIDGEGNAAGVFTKNKIIAAPLVITRNNLYKTQKIGAVIVNSGNANAFTGQQGMADAKEMASILHHHLKYPEENIAVSSTGVIGRKLDIEWIRDHVGEVVRSLDRSAEASRNAAETIMTTDTFHKEIAVEMECGVRIGGIAKGSGMIEPNMGTMLAFIYTDADIASDTLDICLKKAVDHSFNMVVVDGDTSTNDMALLISTGLSSIKPDINDFQEGLDFVLTALAKMIAKDGEGATKLIEAHTQGASSMADAKLASKAIVRSMLVKSAIFGEDPNWGRVISAIGYSGCDVAENKISLSFSNEAGSIDIVRNGYIIGMKKKNLDMLKSIMSQDNIIITADLNIGTGEATAWGCDLSYDYVKINAEYTT